MFFSSNPGSSALISYALSVSATSTAGIVRNGASVRRDGMRSNNDLPNRPPVKSSKRRHSTIQFKIRPNRGGDLTRSRHNSVFVCYLFCYLFDPNKNPLPGGKGSGQGNQTH